MKIILTSQEPELNGKIDPRFGRAKYFVSVDLDTMDWHAHLNDAVEQAHGAGVAASQWVSEQGAQAVISGDFGPNAVRALQAAGMELFLYDNEQTVEEVIQSFQENKLKRF